MFIYLFNEDKNTALSIKAVIQDLKNNWEKPEWNKLTG